MTFSDVHPGDPINASNVQQVIDALKGTAGKGVALAVSAVNDASRYALTLENLEVTNSRAINVLKSDGSVLIRADVTGVTLGSPVNLTANSVAGSAIQDATITNAKLGPDVARANLLVNGGFEVWARGNGPFTASGAFGPDRWSIGLVGGDTLSVSRDTANVDSSSVADAACVFTLSTGGGTTNLGQAIADAPQLNGRAVSFSVRVRTNVANAVRIAINDGTSVFSPFHKGGGTYQTLTVTKTIAAATFGVQVYFAASCTAYIDNAMLVIGSQAANYVPLHPADELARCLRYYEKPADTYLVNGAGLANAAEFVYPHLVRKAVTPTLTISAAGQTIRMGGGGIAVTGYPFTSPGLDKSMFQATVASGIAGGQAVTLAGGSIAIEANP